MTIGTSSRRNITSSTAVGLEQLFALRLWRQRPELLRKLFQCARLRHDVAALLCWGRLGSVHERRLDVVSRVWLYVGFRLSLGLDALPLRVLAIPSRLRLGLAARRFSQRLETDSCGG